MIKKLKILILLLLLISRAKIIFFFIKLLYLLNNFVYTEKLKKEISLTELFTYFKSFYQVKMRISFVL